MLFNSFQYLIFLPVVTSLYYWCAPRRRWLLLLLASFYFYMCWRPEYVIVLLLMMSIDFTAGILIDNSESLRRRRLFLLLSLCSNLGLLFFFKYYNFAVTSLRPVLSMFPRAHVPFSSFVLPMGISFHTFQALSYTIDVYRRKAKPERHLGYFMLYVMFFPQLVAGPIERPTRLLPQLHAEHTFSPRQFKRGLALIAWGLFLKMAVADRLGPVVDLVYQSPAAWNWASLVVATVFFAIQIYCDFAGYSLIAIGSARLYGIELMENFAHPYLSTSVIEFWRRWHMSLTTWFRDYVYFPLGGNRVSTSRNIFNVMLVFLLSGLWHGANWTFVIWGLLHGLWSAISRLTKRFRMTFAERYLEAFPVGILDLWRTIFTFTLVLCIWVFFRAGSASDAATVFTRILGGAAGKSLPLHSRAFVADWLMIALVVAWDLTSSKSSRQQFLASVPVALKAVGVAVLVLWFAISTSFGGQNFIYFQF